MIIEVCGICVILPVAVGTAALPLRALGSRISATQSIGRSLQILGGSTHGALLESENTRLAIVTAIIVLELDSLAAERVLITVRIRVGGKPLRVVGKTKVELLRVSTHI